MQVNRRLLILLVVLLLGVSGIFIYRRYYRINSRSTTSNSVSTEPETTVNDFTEEPYTCENMGSKYNCKGLTPDECNQDPYVQWARENCGLGTQAHPIGL